LQWPSGCEPALLHIPQDQSNYQISHLYNQDSTPLFNYTSHSGPFAHSYHLGYSPMTAESSCPRTYSDLDLVNPFENMAKSYPPSAYLIEPQKPQDMMDMSNHLSSGHMMHFDDDYDSHCQPAVKVEKVTRYGTPQYETEAGPTNIPSTRDTPPSPSHGYKIEHGPDEVTNSSTIDKEQPYAQLIYRALLEAPGHTMVLRDIYSWFRRNTDKATDKETKGWQNSIRHNLSMNGAFEKVDQPDGEEAKKGFMWRLTESAIREGVKSTTRYRSKMPNKRGCRSHNPAPQRQASGAKGGQAARKTARLRRSERLRDSRSVPMDKSDAYMSRSMPSYNAPFDGFPPSELAMGYPASPYFYQSEMDFGHPIKQEPLPASFGPNLDILSGHSYPDSPRSGLCSDISYLLPYSPDEPLFYDSGTDSDEPMTP
ncbi:hypothetical protein K432DRAFT_274273, partial [Lepidopterella palustris CBS 459.81]